MHIYYIDVYKTLQGHLTMSTKWYAKGALNTVTKIMSDQRSRQWIDRKRKVFSSWRNVDSDEAALTEEGKPFHAPDGKARSPSVERFVGATTNVSMTEERRRQRPSTSAVRRRLSARYVGAVPLRQRYTRTHSRNRIRSGTRSHGAHGAAGIRDPISSLKRPVEQLHLGLTEA